MKRQTKILLLVGGALALYWYLNKANKGSRRTMTNPQPQSDVTRESFTIIPLPDIKNAKFTSVLPIYPVGTTNQSPILIAKI